MTKDLLKKIFARGKFIMLKFGSLKKKLAALMSAAAISFSLTFGTPAVVEASLVEDLVVNG